MDPLETILNHEVIVEVYIGIDPAPEELLYQTGDHQAGQFVTQQIHQGIPGVVYLFTCTAWTSEGRTLQNQTKVGILPDAGIIPPLFGELFTTDIYPMETAAFMQNTFAFEDGALRPMPFPLDSMQHAFAFLVGDMYGVLIEYSGGPDSWQNAFAPVDGTLEVKLLTYENPEEAWQNAFNVVSGTLEVKLITYVHPAESIQNAFAPVAGTLT